MDFEEEVTALSDQFSLLDRKMTSVSAIATKFGDRLQVRSSLAVMLPLQESKTFCRRDLQQHQPAEHIPTTLHKYC